MTIIVNAQNGLWSRYTNWMSKFAHDQDADDPGPVRTREDPETGEEHDDADDQHHPTPGLDIVHDRQLPADPPFDVARLRDGDEPVEQMRKPPTITMIPANVHQLDRTSIQSPPVLRLRLKGFVHPSRSRAGDPPAGLLPTGRHNP